MSACARGGGQPCAWSLEEVTLLLLVKWRRLETNTNWPLGNKCRFTHDQLTRQKQDAEMFYTRVSPRTAFSGDCMCSWVHRAPFKRTFFPGIVQGRSLQAGSRIQHRGQLRSGQRSSSPRTGCFTPPCGEPSTSPRQGG